MVAAVVDLVGLQRQCLCRACHYTQVTPFASFDVYCDGYFGYPITPQSEVLETLEELMPWETTGMVVLQAESEVAAINMVYGGAASGKAVMRLQRQCLCRACHYTQVTPFASFDVYGDRSSDFCHSYLVFFWLDRTGCEAAGHCGQQLVSAALSHLSQR